MKKTLTLFSLILSLVGITQITTPPVNQSEGFTPNFTKTLTKSAADSCGAYFNNYIGLSKTSLVFVEPMRTGNSLDFAPFAGRGQRFHAPQPIEVSGLQFYSFQTNETVDSIMVVTLLYDWDETLDSTGTELARDTVWVKHTTFTPLLTEIEVNSYFDEPVVVTEDYIVGIYTPSNDSLKIITNSPEGDGEMEGISFAYYQNPAAPSFTGWYQTLETYGPAYDLDYLISPLVSYQLHNEFEIADSLVCASTPLNGCVNYSQMPVFSDPHYNNLFEESAAKIDWDWGDGTHDDSLTTLCHSYSESGTYTITLTDSIRRHDYSDFICHVEIAKDIEVVGEIEAIASYSSSGLIADFTGMPIAIDSVLWDFGDGETATVLNPTHVYETIGTYTVWFYAYGPCNTDSVSLSVSIDDVGINVNQSALKIYPNPANNSLTLDGLLINSHVEVSSLAGQILFSTQTKKEELFINTTSFSAGIYLVTVYSENGKETYKLRVNH